MADQVDKVLSGAQFDPRTGAPDAITVANVICKALFKNDLRADFRYVALATITGALDKWRQQLLASDVNESEKWKKLYQDAKAEMEEIKTRLFFLERDK